MFKTDLHTHSTTSPDGGITASQYHRAILGGLLDCVAITDHNRIDQALELHRELGDRIIVGEEIMSAQGEIIGLYLQEPVEPGLSAEATIQRIKAQNGLVYIPHPFETVRKGLHPAVLEELASLIDIVEICNGRAFLQNRSAQAVVWAKLNRTAGAASSDAHGYRGLGRTYTSLRDMPTRDNLVELLATATPITNRPGMRALLYPKYHRLRKRVRRSV
jgi:predicted metal-dependent phosphoesterase TrpH